MALVTSCWLCDILSFLVIAAAAIYTYFWHKFQYWQKRKFPVPVAPSFPSGNFAGIAYVQAMDQILADIYKATPGELLVGCYLFTKPIALVRDLDLVKNIMVKDFSHFNDRGFYADLEKDPLGAHLFLMNGQEWRNLRIKLTPTFTSGKMKMMFPTMVEVGRELQQVFEQATKDEETEVKDILARYTTDVISSVAFGIETNSLKNPDAEFRKMGNALRHPPKLQMTAGMLSLVSPQLSKLIPIPLIPTYLTDFFIGIVRETIEYRKKNNVNRNDFMQLLLQLTTLGYIKDADSPQKEIEQPENQQKFTMEQAAAQAFIFFFAGFEASSSTMQFALYELALNPDLQKKVQADVLSLMAKHGGAITYEAIIGMELLDRVVSETLRKYPVAALITRECTKEYSIPGTELKFLPKDSVWFSVYGIHHDPEYYLDPEKFDPDRFLPDAKNARPHYAYLPFGEGPRNCIGNRFALMQTKVGLAVVLSQFTLAPSKKTPIPIVFDPTANIMAPLGDMHLHISKRA